MINKLACVRHTMYDFRMAHVAKPLFLQQRSQAKQRGIDWEFEFEEWWEVWLQSGKYNQRGFKPNEYCMARHKDEGPYAVGNVKIITNRENCQERRQTTTAIEKQRATRRARKEFTDRVLKKKSYRLIFYV